MATSKTITLTPTTVGAVAFDISSHDLIYVRASGSGSRVTYDNGGFSPKTVVVTESPAALITASDYLITVTLNTDASALYLNADRIKDVATARTTEADIYYNDNGTANARIAVNESKAAIMTAVAAVVAANGGDVTSGITAFAGGGQANATQLGYGYSEVTTVAIAGDSVKLPAAQNGAQATVENDGANPMDVFPATGDTINDGAANAAISVAPGVTLVFTAIDSTNWETTSQKESVGDGTAALPSYTFNTDPDTGLYKSAANAITITTEGTGRWTVDATGMLVPVANDSYDIGNGTTDPRTLFLSSNITLAKEINHIVSVTASTTATAAGGNITILSGTGNTTGAGGNILLRPGAGGTSGLGGNMTINTGNGASGTAGTNSGTLSITGGTAGGATTGAAGSGGAWTISSSGGGAATGAAGVGGSGSNITMSTGAGGASSDAAAGAGGASGNIILAVGAGGNTAGAAVAAGAAGSLNITGGAGGACTNAAGGAETGGAGTAIIVAAGAGGAINAASTGTSGAGGNLTLSAGNAGAANGGTSGAAGAVSITAGNSVRAAAGGAITATAGVGGATGTGGGVTITTGAGGSTSGASGNLTIATGTTTAGSGSATGTVTIQSGAGATSAVAVAGGASGAVTIRSQAGGANTGGATGQVGGAGGDITVQGGDGGATNSAGAHAGGAGADMVITAGSGGNATAGTGNGGAGGSIRITPGTGGTSAGGSAGADGVILNRGVVMKRQVAQTAKTTSTTLTAAELLTGIITVNQGGGAASDLTLPLASALDTALPDATTNDSFDFHVINISVVAAEDANILTNTGWTLVGGMDVDSYDATNNNSSATFRARKTGAAAWTLYRLA